MISVNVNNLSMGNTICNSKIYHYVCSTEVTSLQDLQSLNILGQKFWKTVIYFSQ